MLIFETDNDSKIRGVELSRPVQTLEPVTRLQLRALPGAQSAEPVLFMTYFDASCFDNRLFQEASLVMPCALGAAVQKRRAEYFYGRLCAQAALAPHGLAHAHVDIGAMRAPVWPSTVIGSITHTHATAAAMVLPRNEHKGIGIDIEQVAQGEALQALHGNVVSDTELAYLRTCAGDLDMLMTLVFSAKESFFKGVSHLVQDYFDFNALEVEQIDLEARMIAFRVMQTLSPTWLRGGRCQMGFDFLGENEVLTVFVW
jgi:enterobactin synthetase component D